MTKQIKDIAREILKENGIDEKINIRQAKCLIRQVISGTTQSDVYIPNEIKKECLKK